MQSNRYQCALYIRQSQNKIPGIGVFVLLFFNIICTFYERNNTATKFSDMSKISHISLRCRLSGSSVALTVQFHEYAILILPSETKVNKLQKTIIL